MTRATRPLAALIPAARSADDPAGGLRATLPLAGRTLVEHQVRLAADAGAGQIVLLVERVPASLMAAVDRLRRDGLNVVLVRSLAEAVDRVHPEEALLVFADGVATDAATVRRIAAASAPALLTLPDEAANAAFERIDATARWAGLLLINGERLRRTAAMLGEWDLESTLMRTAVQEGAARIETGPVKPRIATGVAALAGAERGLFAAPSGQEEDWRDRPAPIRLAAEALAARGVDPTLVATGSAGAAAAGAVFMLAGLWRVALVALLLVGPARLVAQRLAAMRLAPIRRLREIEAARAAGLAAALLAFAFGLGVARGWGTWPLALALIVLLRASVEAQRLTGERRLPAWRAREDDLPWLLLPFGIAGWWLTGLWTLAAYAAVSLLFVLRAKD